MLTLEKKNLHHYFKIVAENFISVARPKKVPERRKNISLCKQLLGIN